MLQYVDERGIPVADQSLCGFTMPNRAIRKVFIQLSYTRLRPIHNQAFTPKSDMISVIGVKNDTGITTLICL
jgi:hypothetical protein